MAVAVEDEALVGDFDGGDIIGGGLGSNEDWRDMCGAGGEVGVIRESTVQLRHHG